MVAAVKFAMSKYAASLYSLPPLFFLSALTLPPPPLFPALSSSTILTIP
jgi:hypothetical protein